MWRVTWQTGTAYLIFGTVFMLAHYKMVPVDWTRFSIAVMAATGMLGWGLVLSGGLFILGDATRRLVRRIAD
jgi:hypothetical protein